MLEASILSISHQSGVGGIILMAILCSKYKTYVDFCVLFDLCVNVSKACVNQERVNMEGGLISFWVGLFLGMKWIRFYRKTEADKEFF